MKIRISPWEKWISIVNEDTALLLSPAIALLIIINIFYPIGEFGITLVEVLMGYIVLAMARLEIYKWLSKRRGLGYYYILPIDPIFIGRLMRNKWGPKYQFGWRLHVNRRRIRKIHSFRALTSLLRNDVKKLSEWDWGSGMLLGSTYANLGRDHMTMIAEKGHLIVEDKPLLPYYNRVVSRGTILKEQEKIFGKVLQSPERVAWRTYFIWPKVGQ